MYVAIVVQLKQFGCRAAFVFYWGHVILVVVVLAAAYGCRELKKQREWLPGLAVIWLV